MDAHDAHRPATFANRAFARALTNDSQPTANFKSGAGVSRGPRISCRPIRRSPFRARFTTWPEVCSDDCGTARSAAAETSSPTIMDSTIATAAIPPANTRAPYRFARSGVDWIWLSSGMNFIMCTVEQRFIGIFRSSKSAADSWVRASRARTWSGDWGLGNQPGSPSSFLLPTY